MTKNEMEDELRVAKPRLDRMAHGNEDAAQAGWIALWLGLRDGLTAEVAWKAAKAAINKEARNRERAVPVDPHRLAEALSDDAEGVNGVWQQKPSGKRRTAEIERD